MRWAGHVDSSPTTGVVQVAGLVLPHPSSLPEDNNLPPLVVVGGAVPPAVLAEFLHLL